jgi:uncharacterized repeat protein (TIGR03803 family)
MKKLLLASAFLFSISLCHAQYDTIHNFNNSAGLAPEYCQLTYSSSTNLFYGMVAQGGPSNDGLIFCIHPNGSGFRVLKNFTGTNGDNPGGSLILSRNKLFGMTQKGGANNYGVVFSIDTNGGGYKDIWDFAAGGGTNGQFPYGDLLLLGNKLYGMTSDGGTHSFGNIFRVDTAGGAYKDLWDFQFGVTTNGASPYGGLTHIGGKLYGMTKQGGTTFNGNLFRIDTTGTGFISLWSFNNSLDSNGGDPYGNLLLVGNKFYGLTNSGGKNGAGNVFSIDTGGTKYHDIWDLAVAGVDTNGAGATGSLIMHKGSLYGLTYKGAKYNNGNIFKVDTNGTKFKDLSDFNGSSNPCGGAPYGTLALIGNTLYGMTSDGGTANAGVIFSYLDTTIVTSGINTIEETAGAINIYPNPSKGTLTIVNKGSEINSGELEIYNVLGEKVYQSAISDFRSSFNFSLNVPDGVYFLSLKSEQGVTNSKIIVQK